MLPKGGDFFMKKVLGTVGMLALTALLIGLLPRLEGWREDEQKHFSITRVWVVEKEPAVSAWLRRRAAAFEKERGERVYLRLAAEEESDAVLRGGDGPAPDLMILPRAGEPVALRGFALILRDEGASVPTPLPTSALFYRPTPAPQAMPSPHPTPDGREMSAVLAPRELAGAVPGAVVSLHPAEDFAAGKAKAALLTAGQAAGVKFGFRAFPVPEGAGFLPVGGQALSEAGEDFLSFLLSDASQQALSAHGLYAPGRRLYGGEDPLRALIESGRTWDHSTTESEDASR